jgi:hypothetical protein
VNYKTTQKPEVSRLLPRRAAPNIATVMPTTTLLLISSVSM